MVFDIVFRALIPASVVYHNLLLIYRNFLRAKTYFLINLVGLTIGLACTLLIYLWARDEMLMNKFHANDARLYQVMEHQKYADEISTVTSTPGILAETLKEEFPEVEYSAATTWINPYTLSAKDHNVKAKGYHVGKDYFQIFSYKLLQGEPNQVLRDKFAIVISRRLAIKLYGAEENAVGKTVELDHNKSFAVTGIFEDPPATSSLEFDFVTSFEEFKDNNKWTLEWGTSRTGSFLVLREGTNVTAFSEKIEGFVKRKSKESNVTLFLQKFSDRYLHGRYENGQQAGGRIEYVRLFSIIAVVTLLIACINFMNLSTARASRKAKEVGIKKSMGADRQSLILQFITESMVTALLALLIAVALVSLFLPQFNIITDKKIALSFTDIQLLISFLGIALLTGIVSGSYPALYLSGFEPAAVMKGLIKSSVGELWARKGLVVFQFFLSVILIASVLVIYEQINFVETKNLGYKKDHLIQFHMEGAVSTNTETFLNEVHRIP